jgi:hypothetical protein
MAQTKRANCARDRAPQHRLSHRWIDPRNQAGTTVESDRLRPAAPGHDSDAGGPLVRAIFLSPSAREQPASAGFIRFQDDFMQIPTELIGTIPRTVRLLDAVSRVDGADPSLEPVCEASELLGGP